LIAQSRPLLLAPRQLFYPLGKTESARAPAAGMTLAAMEKLLIQDVLKRNAGNRAAAARELGMDASTLFRKLKTLKLKG
jgi:transcriptional regulator with PAS, ATPase and Fis domain